MPLCGQENRWGQRNRRICLSIADMTGLVTKHGEYSRPEVSFIFDGELTKPKVAQKRSVESHTLVHTLRSKRPMPRLPNTSSKTRYGRIDSFRKSLTSEHGAAQLSRYIPSSVRLSWMPDDVPMKCAFRHLSHMTPIWIGMGGRLWHNQPEASARIWYAEEGEYETVQKGWRRGTNPWCRAR